MTDYFVPRSDLGMTDFVANPSLAPDYGTSVASALVS